MFPFLEEEGVQSICKLARRRCFYVSTRITEIECKIINSFEC